MANLATPGTQIYELDEHERLLLLSLLVVHMEALDVLSRLRPESNVGPAFNEAIRLKRKLEGELLVRETRRGL